jgi:hypothetical protein
MSKWNVTEISGHKIYWFVNEEDFTKTPDELDDCSVEHLEDMLFQGYIEGELFVSVNGIEYSGWWKKDPIAAASRDLLITLENLAYLHKNGKSVDFEFDQAQSLISKLAPYAK